MPSQDPDKTGQTTALLLLLPVDAVVLRGSCGASDGRATPMAGQTTAVFITVDAAGQFVGRLLLIPL